MTNIELEQREVTNKAGQHELAEYVEPGSVSDRKHTPPTLKLGVGRLEKDMALCIWLNFMAIVLVTIYSMHLFDRLVRWEYEHHRDQWEHDGKPDGFMWRAKECTFWKSDMAKKRLSTRWVFVTPDWMADSPECLRIQKQQRMTAPVILLLFLGLILQLHN